MSEFKSYAVCRCGWRKEAWRGDLFFVSETRSGCPQCGSTSDFTLRRERLVSDAVWFKPSTWFASRWEPTPSQEVSDA